MNGKCLDIGTMQAFLDGETCPEEAIRISDHVAECDPCTLLLAQAEEESSMVFSVLDRELNSLVPTQRLWTRINAEIAVEKSRASIWQRFLGAFTFSLSSPSIAGAAAVLVVVGLGSAVLLNWPGPSTGETASAVPATPQVGPASASEAQTEIVATTASVPEIPASSGSGAPKVSETKLPESDLRRIITANHIERGPKQVRPVQAAAPQYLPGEESYIRTIGELEQAISPQNAGMKASSQVAFQRDVAVVDDAIEKMREVVRRNPRNQAARQILYSSYQDKIDLLKSSAQRDELMASLQ